MFLLSLVERYPPFYSRADENALTIHYTKNTGEIGAEEMVLVDAGGVGVHLSTED
jgi:Xaa-Pro aminopeptidase